MKQVRVAAVAALVLMSGSAISGSAQAAAQTGKASYYKHGNRTASGEHFNASDYTAAHRTLPFGTRVLVTNLDTGISVIVRVNDRGPFMRSRIIDVSYGAAKVLGITGTGVAQVKIVPLTKAAAAVAPVAAPAPAPAAPAENVAENTGEVFSLR